MNPPSSSCGDGIADGDEPCDGADLKGLTCVTAGAFAGGQLRCTAACTLDTSACSAPDLPIMTGGNGGSIPTGGSGGGEPTPASGGTVLTAGSGGTSSDDTVTPLPTSGTGPGPVVSGGAAGTGGSNDGLGICVVAGGGMYEKRCVGDDLATCSSGGWTKEHCPLGCVTGSGYCDSYCRTCEPNTTQCQGNTRFVCGPDGIPASNQACTYGCQSGQCAAAPPGRILTLVNDLPASPPDWEDWNSIIDIFLGTTSSTAVQQLSPQSSTSSIGNLKVLRPGESISFDVDARGLGPAYHLGLSAGWWDPVCYTSCSWTKHHTIVTCCDGVNYCYKSNEFTVTHTSGEFVVPLSDLLPYAGWYQSPFCQ